MKIPKPYSVGKTEFEGTQVLCGDRVLVKIKAPQNSQAAEAFTVVSLLNAAFLEGYLSGKEGMSLEDISKEFEKAS